MLKSIKIDRQDIKNPNYNWGEQLPSHAIQYADVINFERSSTKQNRCCVLCGDKEGSGKAGDGCLIPKQNKGVCRQCDSTYWLLKKLSVVVKFCKGCKLFFSLVDFDGKPNTTKCGTCRKRGRDNYHGKMERKRHCEEGGGGGDCESDTTVEDEDDEVEEEETGGGGFSVSGSCSRGFGANKKRRKLVSSMLHTSTDTAAPASSYGWKRRSGVAATACCQEEEQESSEESVVAILLGMDNLRGDCFCTGTGAGAGAVGSGVACPASASVAGPWSLLSTAEKEKAVESVSVATAGGSSEVRGIQPITAPVPHTLSAAGPGPAAVFSPRAVSAAQVMQFMKHGVTTV